MHFFKLPLLYFFHLGIWTHLLVQSALIDTVDIGGTILFLGSLVVF